MRSGRKILVLVVTVMILLLGTTSAWAIDEQLFKKIEASLMCTDGCGMYLPTCDNDTAQKMRAEIRSQLEAGASEKEVYAYMVSLYGPEVMAAPPKDNALNISAWVLPFLLILAGGLVIYLVLDRWVFNNRRQTAVQAEAVEEVPVEYEGILNKEIKKYF